MIAAKVIADSKNTFGNRITTMVVTFPRIILAEFNTHRMFSRNSASSRAIPFHKMVKSVQENPFIPIAWQKDHKGMQGSEYFQAPYHEDCTLLWLEDRDEAVKKAKELNEYGVTKQICNRLLEPFMWHTVIVTATEWENFFALRCPQYVHGERKFRSRKDWLRYNYHGAENEGGKYYLIPVSNTDWLEKNEGQAEIHMMALAEAMWDAYNESTPKELKEGEWHIPFGDNINRDKMFDELNHPFGSEIDNAIRIATARCARVSYTVVGEEGKHDNYEADIKLHDRLAASGHWSPFEHCAKAMSNEEYGNMVCGGVNNLIDSFGKTECGFSGNFRGFIQYRKTFSNENITK